MGEAEIPELPLPCEHAPTVGDIKHALNATLDWDMLCKGNGVIFETCEDEEAPEGQLVQHFRLLQALLQLSPCKTMTVSLLADAILQLDIEKGTCLPGT
jgi:hypothetical protein